MERVFFNQSNDRKFENSLFAEQENDQSKNKCSNESRAMIRNRAVIKWQTFDYRVKNSTMKVKLHMTLISWKIEVSDYYHCYAPIPEEPVEGGICNKMRGFLRDQVTPIFSSSKSLSHFKWWLLLAIECTTLKKRIPSFPSFSCKPFEIAILCKA